MSYLYGYRMEYPIFRNSKNIIMLGVCASPVCPFTSFPLQYLPLLLVRARWNTKRYDDGNHGVWCAKPGLAIVSVYCTLIANKIEFYSFDKLQPNCRSNGKANAINSVRCIFGTCKLRQRQRHRARQMAKDLSRQFPDKCGRESIC